VHNEQSQVLINGPNQNIESPNQHYDSGVRDQVSGNGQAKQPVGADDILRRLCRVAADDQLIAHIGLPKIAVAIWNR
jgi:hypothetical protein